MVSKFFLAYADGKTVKELTFEEYIKDGRKRRSLLVHITEHGLSLWKGGKVMWISLPQLKQILQTIEKEVKAVE